MNNNPKILLIYGNKVAYHGSVFGAQSIIDELLGGIEPKDEDIEDINLVDTAWKNSHEKALIYCYGLTLGLISAGCNELRAILDWISTNKNLDHESSISDRVGGIFSKFLFSLSENNQNNALTYMRQNSDSKISKNHPYSYRAPNFGIASCIKPNSYISKTTVSNCFTRLGSESVLWNFNSDKNGYFTRMESFKNESSGLECIGQLFSGKFGAKFLINRTDLNVTKSSNDSHKTSHEYEGLDDLEFDDDAGYFMLLGDDQSDSYDSDEFLQNSDEPSFDRFVGGNRISYSGNISNSMNFNDHAEEMNKSWKTLDSGLCDLSFQKSRPSEPETSFKKPKKKEPQKSSKEKNNFFQLTKLTTSLTSDMSDFENGLNSLKYRMEASNIELDNMQHDMEDALCNYYNEPNSTSHFEDRSSVCCSCNCHEAQNTESLEESFQMSLNDVSPTAFYEDEPYPLKFIKDTSESRTVIDFEESEANQSDVNLDLLFDDDNGVEW